MTNAISISILMTTYNREKYVNEAIESVLNQTYTNYELIIVDDNSSDDTFIKIEYYAKRDKRIRIYSNSNNIGQFPNRNKAASFATGDIIIYLDSDDTIEKNAIAYIHDVFQKFPTAEFATINHNSNLVSPCLMIPDQIIRKHFFEKSTLHVGPGGTVIRRSLFQRIGGFPVDYGPVGDMYYNIKAASNAPTILMPFNYLFYRRHDGQEINQTYNYVYQGYLYFNDVIHLRELPLSESEKMFLLKKNKRRFFVNSFKYLYSTYDLNSYFNLYRLTRFSFQDIVTALFNK